jgi:hypothetical protein
MISQITMKEHDEYRTSMIEIKYIWLQTTNEIMKHNNFKMNQKLATQIVMRK